MDVFTGPLSQGGLTAATKNVLVQIPEIFRALIGKAPTSPQGAEKVVPKILRRDVPATQCRPLARSQKLKAERRMLMQYSFDL